jgi:hypothetical protein
VQRIKKEFEEAPGLAITVENGVKSADGHFKRRPTM